MKLLKYWRWALSGMCPSAALACGNSVFVVFRQGQPKRINIKFVTTWASSMELQLFRFFESFQQCDVSKDLLRFESLKLRAFFGSMLDPRLVQCVAHWVFTSFSQDLGDLQDRAPLLQIQTLDLLDLCSCEPGFLAHLQYPFNPILSDRASKGWEHPKFTQRPWFFLWIDFAKAGDWHNELLADHWFCLMPLLLHLSITPSSIPHVLRKVRWLRKCYSNLGIDSFYPRPMHICRRDL